MTNDSGFLTSHQSLSNYSTLANTVKSISISGKTITVTPGSGNAYTLTTQDTTYTHPTSSGNKHIPSGGSSGQFLGWDSDGTAKWVNNPNSDTKNTAGSTDTSSKIFLIGATSQAANPQTYSHDTAYVGTDGCLYSGGTKVLTAHQSLSNYSTLANTIKSLSISGKTITYTKGDNTTGTLTTQDNNTWTAMVGATSSSNGSVGYVNAVPPKDGYNTKYLRADGTWQVPPDHTYTVNNATLTIQKNGTTVKTFTANASSNVTCNITVPTKVSELTNDSGFLTSHQSLSGYVPKSGGNIMTGSLGPSTSGDASLGDSTHKWAKINDVAINSIGFPTRGGVDVSGSLINYTSGQDVIGKYYIATVPGFVSGRFWMSTGRRFTLEVYANYNDMVAKADPIFALPWTVSYGWECIPAPTGTCILIKPEGYISQADMGNTGWTLRIRPNMGL